MYLLVGKLMKNFSIDNTNSVEIIVLVEPPCDGHGAARRKSFLISYMTKNSIPFILLNQTSKSKLYSGRFIHKKIKSSQIYKQFSTINMVANSLISLSDSLEAKKLIIKFLSFSEYETLYYLGIKALIYKLSISISRNFNWFRQSKIESQILTFSRGDIVSIHKVNHPSRNIKDQIINHLKILYYFSLQYIAFLLSDKYAVQMLFLKKSLMRRFKVKSESVSVISNNLPEEKHTLTNEGRQILEDKRKWDHKNLTIGLVAPMYKYCKGLDIFVDCCHLLEAKYCISVLTAGSGPDELFIRDELNKISGNYFHYGWLGDLRKILDKCDILVIPSRYDSCPNLLLEAISRNSPRIMASNINAHSELLQREDLLFDIGLTDFSLKLQSLMALSDSEYSSMLEERRRVLSFDWAGTVNAWIKS